MAPSAGVVNAFGVGGGIVLIVMALPQLWQVLRTRRAEDISHIFLLLYNGGLVLLSCYNIILKLWVFTGACLLQLAVGILLQLAKVWADRWQRQHGERSRFAQSLSLRSGAKLDFAEFVSGKEAPFPLLHPQPSHAAQHLLLDCRLALPSAPAAAAAATTVHAEAAGVGLGMTTFADVSSLLTDVLSDAGLLLPGAKSATSLAAGQQEQEDSGATSTAMFACKDSYVAVVWHADSASISVDCVAVTEQSMRGMAGAAEAFCARLAQRYPGSKCAASSLGRLPEGKA